MNEMDQIRQVVDSMSEEIQEQLKSLVEDVEVMAKAVRDARGAAKKTGFSVEGVIFYWTYEAIERGLVTEEELAEMDLMEVLILLEKKRDFWMTAGLAAQMKGRPSEN